MSENELKLVSKFLELASEEFSNHGCNDVEESFWKDWSIEERKKFVKEYHDYNGVPDEYDEKYLHLPDFAIMSFLVHKLNNHV